MRDAFDVGFIKNVYIKVVGENVYVIIVRTE